MAVNKDQDETEAMVIRPSKALADWLRRRAADETVRRGRTVTPNKVAVAELTTLMNSKEGGRQK